MAEPLTEAGRDLLELEKYNSRSFTLITAEAILAIEAQAVEAWLQSPEAEERLAAALREMGLCYDGRGQTSLAADLLAALRDSTPTP